MNTWIALFRGINVGGHHLLPMKELIAELEGLGLSDVKTYIQSGNAIFRADKSSTTELSNKIAEAVQVSHDFRPEVMVLSAEAFCAAAADNPFPVKDADAKTLHLYFLAEPPVNPELSLLDAARTGHEQYFHSHQVLYLHTPDGYGQSKLAQKIPRALGVSATARNWRTVTKILEIVEQIR